MGTIAETTLGRLAGREKDGVLRFAGIPYAAPPVGDLRFAPPAAHPGWTGERDASAFGPSAPQAAGTIEMLTGRARDESSEDCLFLNVWTPALDDARRPVMVWIHGGAFTGGSGGIPWYHGHRFVQRGDVVIVTLNYRLGALGWLAVSGLPGGDTATDNAGLLDQIAALQWVRDNIATFGGNPDDVTIFGESAGGMSVATLMGTPAAAGLFHKAIPQSGAAHAVASPESGAEVRDRVLAAAGVADIAGLRALDSERLLEIQTTVGTEHARATAGRPGPPNPGMAYMPVVDGTVLPEPPLDAVRRGSVASVPLLTGTTREEWKLFGLMLRPVKEEATLLRRLGRVVEDPRQFADAYRQADDGAHDDLWTAIMTDRIFRIPAIRLAEAQRAHQPDATWMYQFDWPSTAFDGRLGACHALEIPFVFDSLNRSGTDLFTGPDAPQSLADAMHLAWIAFARNGDPNHDGIPEWPVYDTDRRATLHFDADVQLRDDPGAEARAAWDGVL